MEELKFDFNNMFASSIGRGHGVDESDITELLPKIDEAHRHLSGVLSNPRSRIKLSLEWAELPLQDRGPVKSIQRLGKEIAEKYDNVIFLGIGGSYLGLKAAQDALCAPYYNEFESLSKNKPRIYFEGNNLDPPFAANHAPPGGVDSEKPVLW